LNRELVSVGRHSGQNGARADSPGTTESPAVLAVAEDVLDRGPVRGGQASYAGSRPKTITTVLGPVTLARAW
jgi:hypothetical protein